MSMAREMDGQRMREKGYGKKGRKEFVSSEEKEEEEC